MAEHEETVAVTSKGQATIPKRFREKLRISTPGRVKFVETEDGDVVIRPVARPSDIRGELADGSRDGDTPATDLLREERERDRTELDGTADG